MHKLFTFAFFIPVIIVNNAVAQANELPLDVNGKFSISDIVELPGTQKDFLYKNALSFAKKIKIDQKRTSFLTSNLDSARISTKGSFLISPIGSIGKSIAGAMNYTLLIEVKDGKYRYTITDFILNDYQKNRYGRFEPVTGKYTPLEVEPTKINQKQWEHNCMVTKEKTDRLIVELKNAMLSRDEEQNNRQKSQQKVW